MIEMVRAQLGNWVQVELNNKPTLGKVTKKSASKIGVEADGELSWFLPRDVQPIVLTDDWIKYFGLTKEDGEQGKETYVRGPFKLVFEDKSRKKAVLSNPGEHPRLVTDGLFVNDFQNHYHGLTKAFI